MPPRTIDDDALLARLACVFREHGYSGASLAQLSERSGLGRSSLYHRFPGGKEQMAEAVLESAGAWLAEHVLGPLARPGPVPARLAEMSRQLDAFYEGGTLRCLLDTLSVGAESGPVLAHVRQLASTWRDAFADLAREVGAPDPQDRATRALALIQGSLVVSRALDDPAPFRKALDDLPAVLTGAPGPRDPASIA